MYVQKISIFFLYVDLSFDLTHSHTFLFSFVNSPLCMSGDPAKKWNKKFFSFTTNQLC